MIVAPTRLQALFAIYSGGEFSEIMSGRNGTITKRSKSPMVLAPIFAKNIWIPNAAQTRRAIDVPMPNRSY